MVRNNIISWENPQQQQQQVDLYTNMSSNQKEIYPWMNEKNKNLTKTTTGEKYNFTKFIIFCLFFLF